jgi:hypothetical protein
VVELKTQAEIEAIAAAGAVVADLDKVAAPTTATNWR